MKIRDKQTLSRAEIAELLRGLAEGFESGRLQLGEVDGILPERAQAELEYEEKGGVKELEIEIKWR